MTGELGQTGSPKLRVALLRGINLGGSRKVPMSDLRRVAGDLGWGAVATHLQSGNLLFAAPGTAAEVAAELGAALRSAFAMQVDVVIRDGEHLRRLVEGHPFADGDPSRVVIACCDRPVGAGAADRLAALATGSERVQVAGSDVFADFPDGQAGSRLAAQLVAALKPATGTARNLRTMRKLAELLG